MVLGWLHHLLTCLICRSEATAHEEHLALNKSKDPLDFIATITICIVSWTALSGVQSNRNLADNAMAP